MTKDRKQLPITEMVPPATCVSLPCGGLRCFFLIPSRCRSISPATVTCAPVSGTTCTSNGFSTKSVPTTIGICGNFPLLLAHANFTDFMCIVSFRSLLLNFVLHTVEKCPILPHFKHFILSALH